MLNGIKNKGEILSWCMFDFANSSFTTIVITIVFSVYFVQIAAMGSRSGDFLWSLGNFISQGFVLITAPLFGAIADYSASKKKFLFLSYSICIIFTALLYFVTPGAALLGLILFVIGNFAYSSGENLIASFLPEIAKPEDMGKISGFGWSLGYMGGLLALVCCLPFLKGGFVLQNEHNLRITNLVVAGFFLLAGIPTFLFVRERKKSSDLPPGKSYFGVGIQRIRETFHNLKNFSELSKFLIVFGIYNCGVTTVIYFASIYAVNTIKLTANELIVFFLITQVSSSIGAFLFGLIQDKIGAKRTIYMTLTIWLVVIVGAFLSTGRTTFFIIGNLAGLGLGSSQSAARALVGRFSPIEKSGEFFGFWGLFWKGSSAVGPLVFGTLSSVTGSQRIAILATGLFFLVGMVGLTFVDERKGIEAVKAYNGGAVAPNI
jgi:MFS transporter, UMF1 family